MSIKVNIPPLLYQFTDSLQTVELEGNTVGQVLRNLAEQSPFIREKLFDSSDNLLSYISVFVNRENVAEEELARTVKDGDEINIIILVSGG